jgi:hypothetical protein
VSAATHWQLKELLLLIARRLPPRENLASAAAKTSPPGIETAKASAETAKAV